MTVVQNNKSLHNDIMKIVSVISARLTDPQYVQTICSSEQNHVDKQEEFNWNDISLATGFPAISILYGRLSTVLKDERLKEYAHSYLLSTRESLKKSGASLSLWEGLSGVGFAAYLLSDNGIKYRRFINQINTLILRHGSADLLNAKSRLESGTSINDYDVISGWSGIGRYLLLFSDIPEIRELLIGVLEYLVFLSKDRIINDKQEVPNWYISNKYLLSHEKDDYPFGYFNMGLAHGVPGPLALLSIALLQNIKVPGQIEAIQRYCDWITKWKLEQTDRIQWPLIISYEEFTNDQLYAKKHRDAWCYGSAGVARSLFLAGRSIGDRSLEVLAVNAFKSIYKRSIEEWNIYSPTVCHGYSGLLKITYHMYRDTHDPELQENYQSLLRTVVKMFDEESAFGFYDLYRDSNSTKNLNYVGLLDGVSGIAMTLLDSLYPDEKDWGASLLIC
ncbi:lanthionine synthetase C family protein [Paenibacillus polymyxa]|uniref:lanthionine synthetase C family protein n=1 Tax=Paenibacillus polymyxa TaxID=1406 RepID=UPI002AB436FC|nr:lanthionine synthetase C family protein [Paenibacillus polymyxa]MDY8049385.1 lanthionine synthetase C family protein [Paenibacillus polymyxa]